MKRMISVSMSFQRKLESTVFAHFLDSSFRWNDRRVCQIFAILFSVLALAGCSFAPKYQRPPVATPAAYKEAGQWLQATPGSAALARGPWWYKYDDPVLNELEAQVVGANQNLKLAFARYEEARAILAQQRAAYFPNVLGIFNANKVQTSHNIANVPSFPLFTDIILSTNLTYEVDVWGRVRNSVAAANSLAQASAADLAAIDLSLHAELANDYFTLRGNDAAQRILDKTVRMYTRALYLIRSRYEGGAADISEVDEAISQLNTAKTLAADTRLQRAQLEHAIAVLIGQPPATFSLKPATPHLKQVIVNPELPSVLLERRPDVAEAELKVQAANYNIGVARAAFFPAFNLSAAIGYESQSLGNLLTSPSLIWALGPTTSSALLNNGSMPLVTQTIFDGGRLIALSQQAWAQYHEAVASYRQTVLTAYQEVEDSLVALHQLDQEQQTQAIATAAANHAVRQAMYRYRNGITTYLDVVVIQNLALQAELANVNILTRRQVASVQLIKALGGGY